jgi:hypothetical protein
MASMESSRPKFQFKRKASKKRHVIRSSAARHVNHDDDEEESTLDAIQSAQKKRKLLNAALYKKGLDANETLKPSDAAPQDRPHLDAATKPSSLLKQDFSSRDSGPSETIMEQKHHKAMEDYIQHKLGDGDNAADATDESNDHDYQTLTGQEQEADLGAGGALLGGTGIAEVILPVEHRLETARKTEKLRASLPAAFGKKQSSAAVIANDVDLQGQGASFSHNFREMKQSGIVKNQNSVEQVADTTICTESGDSNRLGFQAARHGVDQREHGRREGNPQLRASDDRVMKEFLKRNRGKNR